MRNLVLYEIGSRWKAILGWSVGLIGFGALYISVYPEVEQQMVGLADLAIYEAMGINLDSFAAYVGSVVLLFIPLLLGIYAITSSTRTLAGEEEDGTLELLMARPLRRSRIVLAKAIALGVALLAILLVAAAGNAAVLAMIRQGYETSITPGRLFLALLSGWPIVMAVAMIGLFLGAFVPTRRTASMTTAFVFIAGYFVENISAMVPSLEFLKPASLFTYYDSSAAALTDGAEAADVLVLGAVALVALLLALISFAHRNVTVGEWPWRRGRRGA
jgi:ABC-2 type transport system permease protein